MNDNFTQHYLPLFDFNGTNFNYTSDEQPDITAERSHIIIYLIIGKWNCFSIVISINKWLPLIRIK